MCVCGYSGLQEELAAKEISVANQNVEIDGMRDAEAQLAQKIQALMEAGEERERWVIENDNFVFCEADFFQLICI